MASANPAFSINSGGVGVKASVSASGAVVATISNIANVRSVAWVVSTTDETTTPASYTLVQSGSVGQTVSTTALTAGTAAILQCTINGGIDSTTGQVDYTTTRATAKFYVPTLNALEVGCAGEDYESNATFGSTGIVNAGIRKLDSGVRDTIVVAPDGATVTFDFSLGTIQKVTIAANRAIAFSNVRQGVPYKLEIVQSGGGNTVTWPGAASFGVAGTPSLSAGAGKKDLFLGYSDDGTNILFHTVAKGY